MCGKKMKNYDLIMSHDSTNKPGEPTFPWIFCTNLELGNNCTKNFNWNILYEFFRTVVFCYKICTKCLLYKLYELFSTKIFCTKNSYKIILSKILYEFIFSKLSENSFRYILKWYFKIGLFRVMSCDVVSWLIASWETKRIVLK